MTKDFEKIINEFKVEFGFDFLLQTRKREYIEARSVVINYFYNYRQMGLTEIARAIGEVSRYNKRLDTVLKKVLGTSSIGDMKTYIQHTVANLDDGTVNEMFKTASNNYAAKLIEIEINK